MIFLARKQGAGHNDPSSSLAVLHPSWREQLPFQGKVAEAEAGCEEMLMPSGSEISLPVCLTISPKRMQVPRAGVDKKKKKIFFFLKSQLVNISAMKALWSLATTQLCSRNKIPTNEHGCVPIKLYLHKQELAGSDPQAFLCCAGPWLTSVAQLVPYAVVLPFP